MSDQDCRQSPKLDPSPSNEIPKLESEIAGLREELAEARKSNQQYLQNVAHQLTAPLGAIKWSIEALKDAEVSLTRKSKLLSSINHRPLI
jgi:signal transduction histidine kinase